MRQLQPFFHPHTLRPLILIAAVVLLGLYGPSARVGAQTGVDDVQISDVQIGFRGHHKQGYWVPVWTTVVAGGADVTTQLEITSLDGSGLEVKSARPAALSVPANQTLTMLEYVKIGRQDRGLSVALHREGRPPIRKHVSYVDHPRPVNADAELILSLGGDIGVTEALARDASAGQTTTVQLDSTDQLPIEWFGYEGVDTIVVTTFENRLLDAISRQQSEAIRQWVEMGGQLIFCVGADGERILTANENSAWKPLADLVPGRYVGVETLSTSAALENYTGGGQALQMTAERRLPMTVLDDVRGNLELFDIGVNGRRPMVVRAPSGFGRIVFVAFDLDQAPLSEWEGRSRMAVKLIRGESAQEKLATARQQSGQVSHVGYHDLVGQLRGALDQFENVSFVAFSVVATLILVYIILIGPADFFFLKNVVGRMQLTWVTFPVIVVAFVALALVLKSQLKNDAILVNQVDLIDIDVSTGLLRGTTWAHLYSPVTETYDVAVHPVVTRNASAPTTNLLSWQGMPGTGLGGLSSTATAASFAEPYAVESASATPVLAGLPIPVGATSSISSRWWQRSEWAHEATLTSDADDLLRGTVINPLDVELHDCMIFYADWAYHLERIRGRLAPGQTARAEDERPRNLQWRMTRKAVKDMKDVATPWDPASFDVPRIMEMMMFQGVAGGDQYTKLSHRYQDYIDLSTHLKNGRAILIGRIEERGTHVAVNGQEIDGDAGRHWTFCRIVFPVDRSRAQSQ